MINHYKIRVRTGDGNDHHEPNPLQKMGDTTIFTHIEPVLNLAYELFDEDQTRKVTIEEYDRTRKLLREIDMFENMRRL